MTAVGAERANPDLRDLFILDDGRLDVETAFAALRRRHVRDRWHYLGFPVAYDLEFPATFELLAGRFFNNISTEQHWPPGRQHAMEAEIAVLDWLSDLFGIDKHHRWGHGTTGCTGGNLTALRRARALHPDAVLLYSAAGHYSLPRAAADFGIPATRVEVQPNGAIDLDRFDEAVGQLTRGIRPGGVAVIVAVTWGTTLTEACDDLGATTAILDAHHVSDRYLHVDAALAGISLALDGLADLTGAHSVSVSGYKFLAVPEACGIVLGHGSDQHTRGTHIRYTDTLDATETGVRSGLAPAMMFEAIAQHGRSGHQVRAHASQALADYAIEQLTRIGVPAWRNPSAYFTVVLPTPAESVLAKWTLANDASGASHIVCVPGVVRAQINEFVTDVEASQHEVRLPQQRSADRPALQPCDKDRP